MGKKDHDYQIVYRGETLPRYVPGGLVFFSVQKSVEAGTGWGELVTVCLCWK